MLITADFRPISIVLVAACIVVATGSIAQMASGSCSGSAAPHSDDPLYAPWPEANATEGDLVYAAPSGQHEATRAAWPASNVDWLAPAVKNDPRAGTGRKLPDNEVERTVMAAANSRFLEMMCRGLEETAQNSSRSGPIEA